MKLNKEEQKEFKRVEKEMNVFIEELNKQVEKTSAVSALLITLKENKNEAVLTEATSLMMGHLLYSIRIINEDITKLRTAHDNLANLIADKL